MGIGVRRLIGAASIILLMCSSFSLCQTIVFEDDFESPVVSYNEYPAEEQDNDPQAQTGTWSEIYETNLEDVQISRDNTNPEPGPSQNLQYAAFFRDGYTWARGNFSSIPDSRYLTISFDLFVPSNVSGNFGMRFWVRDSTDNNFLSRVICGDYFRANGVISHYNSASGQNTCGNFATDQWVHVTYVFDFEYHNYRLTIGQTTYYNLSFWNNEDGFVSQAMQLAFQCPVAGSEFYLDNIAAEKVVSPGNNTAYISTADNQWVLWLPMDSEASISAAIDALAKDFHCGRLLWRGAQDEIWAQSQYFRKQNRFYYDLFKWIGNLVSLGTNESAKSAARRNNMEIWAIYGLFEFRGEADTPGFYPYPDQDYISIEHPEWMPVNKYGTRRQCGPIAFCYPEARSYLVNLLKDFLISKDYDGVSFYTYTENYDIRYQDEFGYNEPIVQEFKRRHRVDIRTQPFDKQAWARLQGEYVTQFFRELKSELSPQGKRVAVWLNQDDPNKPNYWSASPLTITAGNIHMDWQQWVNEGIVDELMMNWLFAPSTLEEVTNYCKNTSTCVSAGLTYGSLPEGVDRILGAGSGVESGYGYENAVGYSIENTPGEPLSSLYGTDKYAKRRVLYLIQKDTLAANVSDITPVLNDPDVYVRRGALRALEKIRNSTAIPYMEAALNDSENSVRCQAAVCLGNLRGPETLRNILETVASHGTFQYDFEAVRHSLLAMKAQSAFSADEINTFIWALTHTNSEVRHAALRNLYQIDCGSMPQLKPYMLNILANDPDVYARELAVMALNRYGSDSEVVNALRLCFNQETDEVVQVRAANFQTAEDLEAKFRRYGDLCTRNDFDWGWREIGNRMLGLGTTGDSVLQDLMLQKEDARLAELAWKVKFLSEQPYAYSFVTEEQDAIVHQNRPLTHQWKQTLFHDDFENVNAAQSYPASGDFDPSAGYGSWIQILESSQSDIRVSREKGIDPIERRNHLTVHCQSSENMIRGNFIGDAVNYSIYPQIIISFFFYSPLESTGGMDFVLRNTSDIGTDKVVLQCSLMPDGTVVEQSSSGSRVIPALEFRKGQWERAIFVINFSKGSYDLHLADQDVLNLPLYSSQNWAEQLVFSQQASGSIFHLDNIDVIARGTCVSYSEQDLNGDCRVNMQDYAILLESWLQCNLDPSERCFQ